jgi:hypothetical protein
VGRVIRVLASLVTFVPVRHTESLNSTEYATIFFLLLAGFNVQIAKWPTFAFLAVVGSAVDEELHGFVIFMKVMNRPLVTTVCPPS